MTDFVDRSGWGARAPRKGIGGIQPIFGVTLHWEGPTLGDYPHTSCPTKVRGIQAFHMDQRGWLDIAYTSIVCRHGTVYDCRGGGKRTAANGTDHGNDVAYAVCVLMGVGDTLTDEALEGVAWSVALLRFLGGAGQGINLHSDWRPTQCPGPEIAASLPRLAFRLTLPFGDAAPDVVSPTFEPALFDIVDALGTPSGGGAWLLAGDGSIYTTGWAPYLGGMNPGTPNGEHFVGRRAAKLEARDGGGYIIVATSGERYVP